MRAAGIPKRGKGNSVSDIHNLADRIRKDMMEIGQPTSIRSAASIAQQYLRLGFHVPLDEAEEVVRRIARELRFTVF